MQNDENLFERLRRLDEDRPTIPGEHWLAFGVGMYFLLKRRQTVPARLASLLVGTAFVARAERARWSDRRGSKSGSGG